MAGESSESRISGSLKSVTGGASLYLIGRIFSNSVGLIKNIVLTRLLGASLYGTFSYVNVVFSIVYIFTKLGSDKAIMRFLPEYEQETNMQKVVLSLAFITSLTASIIISGIIYVFAPTISKLTLNEPLFIDVLQIAAVVIPFNTLFNITLSIFKGIERMDYNTALSSIVSPLSRLIFIGGAVYLGYSVTGAAAGIVVAGIVAFLSSILILNKYTNLVGFRTPTSSFTKEYYNFSLPLTISQVGSIMYKRVDVIMVGIFLSSQAVGIYNVAVIISTIISLPLSAFRQLFPPIASKLYNKNKLQELENTYQIVTRWIFTISLFPGIAAIVYSIEILHIFGDEFSAGYLVLSLFIFAQLTNALVGPSGHILVMTDHQYLSMLNKLTSGAVNIVLNYILILEYGLIGAAVATAFSLSLINVVRVLQVQYLEGIQPYSFSFVKPLSAGIISIVVLYVSGLFLSNYLLLVAGGSAGAVSYVSILYISGFEQEEKDMLKTIIPNH